MVSLGVIELSRNSWRPYAAALFAQLQRAALSVELNLAEGYTYGDTANLTRHPGIAYGSGVGTEELLRLGLEAHVLETPHAAELLKRASRASRLILGLLKPRRRFC